MKSKLIAMFTALSLPFAAFAAEPATKPAPTKTEAQADKAPTTKVAKPVKKAKKAAPRRHHKRAVRPHTTTR